MGYKRILAAIELAEDRCWPLAAARGLTSQHGAKLIALSVLEPVSQLFGGLDTMREPGFENQMSENALAELEEICRTEHVPSSAAVVEFGPTASTIANYAKMHNVDLITVGAHGFHGLEYFLGTTAAAILHAAHCDVLGVRSEVSGRYQRLVVAVDGEDSSVTVLRRAAAVAPQAKLELVHVIKPLLADHGSFFAGMEQELSVENIEGRLHEVVLNRLRDVSAQAGVTPAGIHVLQGTPSKEIKRLVKKTSADLVVMGCGEPAGSGWLIGSTTQNVLHGSASDVLVVRGQ